MVFLTISSFPTRLNPRREPTSIVFNTSSSISLLVLLLDMEFKSLLFDSLSEIDVSSEDVGLVTASLIAWTHEEEIALAKGWVAVSKNSKYDSLKWKTSELPKFAEESEGGSKSHKSSGSSSFNTEYGDASINMNTNVGDNDEDEVQKIRRTIGRDKARAAA
ncbi:hypothetical protein Tco_0538585 [Tanacetum coccineum]